MRELEFHHFVPPNKLMDIGLESQAISITKKITKHCFICFSMEGRKKTNRQKQQNTAYTKKRKEKKNLNLIKSLDSTTNFRNTDNHVKIRAL